MFSRSPDPRRNVGMVQKTAIVLALASLTLVAACAGKTAEQLATDELNAGLAAQNQGDINGAAAHYKACLKHDSLNEFCIYDLGVIAQNANRALEAENDYRLALLIDPNFSSAVFNLAILRTSAGSTVEAIQL